MRVPLLVFITQFILVNACIYVWASCYFDLAACFTWFFSFDSLALNLIESNFYYTKKVRMSKFNYLKSRLTYVCARCSTFQAVHTSLLSVFYEIFAFGRNRPQYTVDFMQCEIIFNFLLILIKISNWNLIVYVFIYQSSLFQFRIIFKESWVFGGLNLNFSNFYKVVHLKFTTKQL